jgi:rsbT co-antagonist protein RsbR
MSTLNHQPLTALVTGATSGLGKEIALRLVAAQQEAIRELSTPVLQVQRGVLVLPLIGAVDAERAQMLTDRLLRRIRAMRARVVVMDVTGMTEIDPSTAERLVHTVASARLLGSAVIVTGMSSVISTTLVTLGVDLSQMHIAGDLQSGLELAQQLVA